VLGLTTELQLLFKLTLVLIASRRDGRVQLDLTADYLHSETVTHPGTNRAGRKE